MVSTPRHMNQLNKLFYRKVYYYILLSRAKDPVAIEHSCIQIGRAKTIASIRSVEFGQRQ